MDRIKVAIICCFYNNSVGQHLIFSMNPIEKFIRLVVGKYNSCKPTDIGVWNTYAIEELKKYEEIELHVISPFKYLDSEYSDFEIDGVMYHFFKDEDSTFITFVIRSFKKHYMPNYQSNVQCIISKIKEISPDIVHMMGAENPCYSTAFLDRSINPYHSIIQLQTVMSIPSFKCNYPIDENTYIRRCTIEKAIITKAKYIGAKDAQFVKIAKMINPQAIVLDIDIALGPQVKIINCRKQYDFVYFGGLEKALDIAIDALKIATKYKPNITLNVVGGGSMAFMTKINNRIKEYRLENNVIFEGRLSSHMEVIEQIQKSKFALLPLRVDYISSTIREAFACGLPVVSTNTDGTPTLNEEVSTILLSDISDIEGIAKNMIRLMSDVELAQELRRNAFEYSKEHFENAGNIKQWVKCYKEILSNNN